MEFISCTLNPLLLFISHQANPNDLGEQKHTRYTQRCTQSKGIVTSGSIEETFHLVLKAPPTKKTWRQIQGGRKENAEGKKENSNSSSAIEDFLFPLESQDLSFFPGR